MQKVYDVVVVGSGLRGAAHCQRSWHAQALTSWFWKAGRK